MHKKLIFFDGDGTLWYPKATKRTRKPWWIYHDIATKDNFLEHLVPTPAVAETLIALRKKGILTIVLSTHPHEAEEAARVLKGKIEHFDLHELFDELHATPEYHEAKGEKILELLKQHKIAKKDALMVGDSYKWDYAPAVEAGIEAVLINSDYHLENAEVEPAKIVINELDELLALLDLV